MPVPVIVLPEIPRYCCRQFFPSHSALRNLGSITSRYCHSNGVPTNTKKDFQYWEKMPAPPKALQDISQTPKWFVHGKPIKTKRDQNTVGRNTKGRLSCWSGITSMLRLSSTPRLQKLSRGPESEIVTYSVWTVDPTVAKRCGIKHQANPHRLISLPQRTAYSEIFPDCPNTDLCNSDS